MALQKTASFYCSSQPIFAPRLPVTYCSLRARTGGEYRQGSLKGYPGKNRLISGEFLGLLVILELGLSVVGVGPQAADHTLNRTQLDPRLARRRQPLVVLAQAATAPVTRMRLLHHPTDPYRLEARFPFWLHRDLNLVRRLVVGHPPLQRLVLVFIIHEDLLEPRVLFRC